MSSAGCCGLIPIQISLLSSKRRTNTRCCDIPCLMFILYVHTYVYTVYTYIYIYIYIYIYRIKVVMYMLHKLYVHVYTVIHSSHEHWFMFRTLQTDFLLGYAASHVFHSYKHTSHTLLKSNIFAGLWSEISLSLVCPAYQHVGGPSHRQTLCNRSFLRSEKI